MRKIDVRSLIKLRKVPALYAQEKTADKMIYLRLTLFAFDWQWFVCECEIQKNDILFFGYVVGFENEWGYFRLRELIQTGRMQIDGDFKPMKFSKAQEEYHF